MRDERLLGRPGERADGGRGRRERVERRQADMPRERQDRQDAREEGESRLRGHEDAAPVEGIREQAAHEGEHDDGEHAHEAERAQPEGGGGDREVHPANREMGHARPEQLEYLPVSGDGVHLRTDRRDRLRAPQQAKVAVAQDDEARREGRRGGAHAHGRHLLRGGIGPLMNSLHDTAPAVRVQDDKGYTWYQLYL